MKNMAENKEAELSDDEEIDDNALDSSKSLLEVLEDDKCFDSIVFQNENGENVELKQIGSLEYEDTTYFMLQEKAENGEDGYVYIFKKAMNENGEMDAVFEQDSETANKVLKAFIEMLNEEEED